MFSVIVPVYNVVDYVESTLDSIITAIRRLYSYGANVSHVEVICVDDGSTDGSGKKLDEYMEKFRRENEELRTDVFTMFHFKVIHQKNGGVSSARNCALKLAAGEWICFVDSDDLVGVDYFVNVVRAAEKYPTVDMVGFGLEKFEDQAYFALMGNGDIRLVDTRKFVAGDVINRGFWQFAYRRTVITGLEFPPYPYGEDLVWRCEALSRANEVALVDACAYAYRQREGSAMTKVSTPQGTRNVLKVRELMFTAFQNAAKSVPVSFVRGYGNAWIERTPYVIFRHRKDTAWDGVWEAWLDSLSIAGRMRLFTPWMRFVAKLVSITRSRIIAVTICVFPHFLKVHGVHR